MLIGINDISWPGTAFARGQARPTLAELQAGYRTLAERARHRGVRIVGATLPPFAGALPGTPLDDYYHPDKDALRQQLNAWLRSDSPFDAVIDLDAALRDPTDPARMAARTTPATTSTRGCRQPGDGRGGGPGDPAGLQGSAPRSAGSAPLLKGKGSDPINENPGQARGFV